MSRRAIKRCMHQPDVALARRRSRIIGKETLRHMGRIERQTMECGIANLNRRGALMQKVDVWPQIPMCPVIEQCIMVTPDQHSRYASFRGARELGNQEGAGFQIRVAIVKDVARQNQHIDLFRDRQVDDIGKGFPAGLFQPIT